MAVRVNSLRKRTFEAWVKDPYVTAKKLCADLQLDYKQHGNYLNRLLSEFRSYHSFGLPQEAHFPEHRVFEWGKIPRLVEEGGGMHLIAWRAGWRVVHGNRNDMWIFKEDRGSVHWYKEGLVRLYLKGELQLAKAKELFCRAFSWFSPQELRKYLDVPLVEKYRKWTFEMGQPVPRFDIRTFERSHGLRIFTDGSHPTCWHVGETVPFWIDEQRQFTAEFSEVIQQFGLEIREHLKLIKLWQREAKHTRSIQLKSRKQKVKEKPSQKSLFEWLL